MRAGCGLQAARADCTCAGTAHKHFSLILLCVTTNGTTSILPPRRPLQVVPTHADANKDGPRLLALIFFKLSPAHLLLVKASAYL